MDEFKNLKSSSGKYAFVMYDPNSHMINDVLPDRIQKQLMTIYTLLIGMKKSGSVCCY